MIGGGGEKKIKIPRVRTYVCASNSGSRSSTKRRHVRYVYKPRAHRTYGLLYNIGNSNNNTIIILSSV